MKATISELWGTGREIISYNYDEFDRPKTIAELRKCSNVIIGEKMEGNMTEVMISDSIVHVIPSKVIHPADGSTMIADRVNWFLPPAKREHSHTV